VIETMRDPKRVVEPIATTSSPAATERAPTPPAPETAATAPRPAPVVPVVIADGSPFRIILAEDIPADAAADRPLRFTVADNVVVDGSMVIAKGTAVTGEVAGKAGKKFLSKGKLTFRLLQAEGADGKPLRIRATPAEGPTGSTRPLETKGARSKQLAAARGTEYIGYIDGEQTVAAPR
jgi:hypothetical protein